MSADSADSMWIPRGMGGECKVLSLSSCLDKASCFSLISFSMTIGFLGPYMLSGQMFGRGERLDLRGWGP